MHQNRTVHFVSSVLTSIACLILAGCSVSTQSGAAAPPRHTHERHADSSKKAPSPKKPKQHKTTSPKNAKASETVKEVTPATTKSEEPPPKVIDRPEVTPEKPLKAGISRLVIPVNVSFKAVKANLEEELPKTESRDWKRVNKKSKKYDADVRYTVFREPVKLSMKDQTLRVVVPVNYASEIRVKVDKPIGKGSFWLTRGETWGTKEHPQHMDVTIDLSLSVGENYELESHSKLVSIEHGAPPSGNACGKVGVEICIPKKELASYVEDELNDHLGKKIEKALKKGDNKVAKLFDLRKRVSTLWTALSTPVELQKPKQVNCPTAVGEACSKSAWLTFAPSALGLSPLELTGDDLGVRVELQGKLSVTETKSNKPTADLPKLKSITGGTEFELATAIEIPIAQVTEQLSKALLATPLHVGSTSLNVKSASIRVTDGAKKSLAIEIVTEKDHVLGFEAKVDYDAKTKLFGLRKLAANATTKGFIEKELQGLDLAELEKTINDNATVALDKASTTLRQAIASALSSALPGKLRLKGTLSEFALEDFSLSDKAIAARVVLRGPLSVEFTP